MNRSDPVIRKKVRGSSAYYDIHWSRLKKVDKYDIIKTVPSEAGIYELYYKDERGKLRLWRLARAWYGGLRSVLREETDPELDENEKSREVLTEKKCFYRYSLTYSYEDMTDIMFFFTTTYFPKRRSVEHSRRYDEIFVNESSEDKLVDI